MGEFKRVVQKNAALQTLLSFDHVPDVQVGLTTCPSLNPRHLRAAAHSCRCASMPSQHTVSKHAPRLTKLRSRNS